MTTVLTIDPETLTGSTDFTESMLWLGGPGTAAAYGDFDGGTVTFAVSYDGGGDWVAGVNPNTVDKMGSFSLPQGVLIRGQLQGAGGAASVKIHILRRPKNG